MLKQNYFNPNAVYVIDGTSQDEVLKKIYDKLLENGYVKGNF